MSSCTLSPAGESDDNTSNSGTLVTTDAISQLENRKLSNRQISSSRKAHSIDSEAAALYTGAELAEYAKETILPPFLAVSVLRGDMVPKHEADNRLHHTYDTIIRILSLQDSTYKDKDNVDPEAYALQSHLPPITVSKVFDGYRQLKASLEDIGVQCNILSAWLFCALTVLYIAGVFSRDTQDKAKQYNEGESIRRYAMIIPAIFPRTYRRSSLGLSLTEPQLQTRVVQLNLWVGALLTAFQTLPSEAQSMILDFLSIPPPDVDESDKALENTPQNAEALTRKRQNELFSAMLKGTYTPPPKPVEVDVKRKHTDMGLFSALMPKSKEEEVKFDKQNSFLKIDNNKSSTQSQSSLPLPPPAPLYTEVERQLSEASMATTASKVLTPMQIAEYSKEVIVHTFLAIHLVNGPKVAKKANEQATHPGYAITLRVLPLNEVQYASKDRIDGDAYQKLICGNNNQPYCISVTRAFDSYRTLKNELELCGVYCHDAKGIRPTSIILEASFPKTYKRSSLGVKLTDSQIRKRQAELNRFMGSVLTKYHLYSNDAKELISNFFQLDEDNPAEPFGRLMLSMMNRKFQPPMLPDKSAQSEASKQNGNAKNSQVTNKESSKKKKAKQGYSYGKVRGKFDPAKYAEEMGDEEDDGNSADINDHDYGQGGAGCCVPGGACNIM
eukprot:scaffold967_cov173-Ochromonas_danica.AAC.47